MKSNNAGGGYGSRQVVRSQNPKVEPKAKAVRPGATAQLGTALGNHIMGRGGAKLKAQASLSMAVVVIRRRADQRRMLQALEAAGPSIKLAHRRCMVRAVARRLAQRVRSLRRPARQEL
jgi:hypothetical protein